MAEAGTKVSLDQKIQVVRGAFDAFNRGDMKALSDAWTDDFVWHARGSVFGGDFKGKDAAIGAIARYPQELQDIELDFHDFIANDRNKRSSCKCRISCRSELQALCDARRWSPRWRKLKRSSRNLAD